ncbi:hypothetical protein H257_08536 [Aphanomyces astaci]|uniref:Uncharacterized protein n=1 Tax=Aphanomyces astaci TaxID=112090 RepID=W4GDA1_APHAT|nr:hypothetical protein H257_08536 [Aphanomyces astaci]ETV77635.1 hypothetical protein H257_08536 [Aphanomyces astaci]|eukprot:XP_009832745.1 hypothetical protein H257_08536 [Aphanomyces astaci]
MDAANARKAAFERIRKMPSWTERAAFVMSQRRRRHQRRKGHRHHRDVSPVLESIDVFLSNEDEPLEAEEQPPFLPDIDTLVSRRRIRQTHKAWVQIDPLQVMFTDFYKMMEG